MKSEFSFAKAIAIHRLGVCVGQGADQPKPDPFLKPKKHPKILFCSYSDWRLPPPALR
jgi:hypothetical protein